MVAALVAHPVVVYLAGLVTGPIIKPVVRGSLKGSVKAGMYVKRVVGDAASEVKNDSATTETVTVMAR